MSDYLREKLGISQARLAAWLGRSRSAVAMAENGRRTPRLDVECREVRLVLAASGRQLDLTADPAAPPPALPPLPPPPPDPGPLLLRRAACGLALVQGEQRLRALESRAGQLQNRLAALPILRAYAGPVADPTRDAEWFDGLEQEALLELAVECGPGPQALLAARLAGLRAEEAVLAAALPPPPQPEDPAGGGGA